MMAGPSIEEIMAMAQKAQEDLQRAQDELGKIEVEGVAGGGLVRIRATAKGQINGVSIDDSLMEVAEKAMLEDLVAAALNDARMKADQAAAEEMRKATAGMPLPPGMKF